MKKLLILAMLFTVPSMLNAKAITFKDINWEMNHESIIEAITKDMDMSKEQCINYKYDFVMFCRSPFGGKYIAYVFKKNSESIQFHCETFNGCGYSLREIAESIDKKIQGLSDWSTQFELLGNFGEYYCANGELGDKICTSKMEDGTTSVILLKGSLGNKPLDF